MPIPIPVTPASSSRFHVTGMHDVDLALELLRQQIEQVSTLGSVASESFKSPVQNVAALKAVAPADRADKDQRLCEDKQANYYFNAEGTDPGDDDLVVAPTTGTGRWYKIGGVETFTSAVHALTSHAGLPGVPAAEVFTQAVHDLEDHSSIPGVPAPEAFTQAVHDLESHAGIPGVPADSDDLTNASTVSGTTVTDALNTLAGGGSSPFSLGAGTDSVIGQGASATAAGANAMAQGAGAKADGNNGMAVGAGNVINSGATASSATGVNNTIGQNNSNIGVQGGANAVAGDSHAAGTDVSVQGSSNSVGFGVQSALVQGNNNTVPNGEIAVFVQGQYNQADANETSAQGRYARATELGVRVWGAPPTTRGLGKSQTGFVNGGGSTSDASTPLTTLRLPMAVSSAAVLQCWVVGRSAAGGHVFSDIVTVRAYRDAAGNVSISGSPTFTLTLEGGLATAQASIVADTTGQFIGIVVQGDAGVAIAWVSEIKFIYVEN
jgi:hypothetical protein